MMAYNSWKRSLLIDLDIVAECRKQAERECRDVSDVLKEVVEIWLKK